MRGKLLGPRGSAREIQVAGRVQVRAQGWGGAVGVGPLDGSQLSVVRRGRGKGRQR